ncbi:hypothetical protein Tco_0177851 [Tanacetum coccineum]
MVPRAVLMKSGLVSINTARQNISKTAVLVNTARQVNAAHSKTTVNAARPMSYLSKTTHSTVKRPINNNTTFKNSNINQRVNTVRGKNVNTARPKAVVNVVQGNNVNAVKASACWVWKPKTKVLDHGNPQMDLQDKGVIDSGCSRHMTGNMSYLTDYEEIDGGYVAFGGNPKGGKITGKGTIKTGNLDFENFHFKTQQSQNQTQFLSTTDRSICNLFDTTMTTLADKSLLSGGDNKPPMLEKHLYDSWKSRMELYMMNRPHGRMILASIEKGPLVWPSNHSLRWSNKAKENV